ncbi:MAG: hypothetical protein HY459_00460 [Parcubacteria group bacterium]|nr:hypothetical protein [Parcubacteria group bacterium]
MSNSESEAPPQEMGETGRDPEATVEQLWKERSEILAQTRAKFQELERNALAELGPKLAEMSPEQREAVINVIKLEVSAVLMEFNEKNVLPFIQDTAARLEQWGISQDIEERSKRQQGIT